MSGVEEGWGWGEGKGQGLGDWYVEMGQIQERKTKLFTLHPYEPTAKYAHETPHTPYRSTIDSEGLKHIHV